MYAINKNLIWYTKFQPFYAFLKIINFRKLTQWLYLKKRTDLNTLLPHFKTRPRLYNSSLKFKIVTNIKRSRTHLTHIFSLRRKHNYLTATFKKLKTLKTFNLYPQLLNLKPKLFLIFWHLGFHINMLNLPSIYSANPNKQYYLLPLNLNSYHYLLYYWFKQIVLNYYIHTEPFKHRRQYFNYYNYKIKTTTPKTIKQIFNKYDLIKILEVDYTTLSIYSLPTTNNINLYYFLLLHTFWNNTALYNWRLEY